MSTMGAKHPSDDQLPKMMIFSEKLRFSPSAVSRSLSRIMLYLTLVVSSMCHFHITVFVALNSGRQKFTFTFFEVMNFPAWFSHIVFAASFALSFYISLPIKNFELLLLFNRIRKFLNYPLPLWVFIQPCRIGE